MSMLRSATLALATAGVLASPAAAVAKGPQTIYTKEADRQALRFLHDLGPGSAIAALPSGPCLRLDRRAAVCAISVMVRVQVTDNGPTEPWICDAYVVVRRRNDTTSSHRTSAECRRLDGPAAG